MSKNEPKGSVQNEQFGETENTDGFDHSDLDKSDIDQNTKKESGSAPPPDNAAEQTDLKKDQGKETTEAKAGKEEPEATPEEEKERKEESQSGDIATSEEENNAVPEEDESKSAAGEKEQEEKPAETPAAEAPDEKKAKGKDKSVESETEEVKEDRSEPAAEEKEQEEEKPAETPAAEAPDEKKAKGKDKSLESETEEIKEDRSEPAAEEKEQEEEKPAETPAAEAPDEKKAKGKDKSLESETEEVKEDRSEPAAEEKEQEEEKPVEPAAAEAEKGKEEEAAGEPDEDKPQETPDTKKDTEEKEEGEQGAEPTPPKFEPEKIDYTKLSKEDLVKVMKDLIDTGLVNEIRRDIETIKSNFYKKHKAEIEKIRKKFLAEGGQIQDFKVEESPVEHELKELLNRYRDLRSEQNKKIEEEKEDNLNEKLAIIEGIKDLVNSQESLNKTFQEFRDLQNRWREAGPVPQSSLKDLWESYHYHVEAFYDYIKINKELRDLDFKKNMEAKIKLCESAEELLLEPSVVEAFRKLQKLHDQWREIGPVPIEKRSELWERFKEATTKINRKHQEYFVNLKQEQKKNYEEKLVLCEKAEEIASFEIDESADWEKKSRELIELQKVWKKIGFAPKKYNTQVYERFRKACDSFFDKKREHYSHNREEQQNNLQLKTELCIQAEAIQNNTDWKKTTNELITLQKKWKEIGPVPIKQSEKIWKRFRAACDTFFNNKSEYYSQIDTRYEENLEKKNALIKEIEDFELTKDVEKNLESLKEFQRQWAEIGFVPIKQKNEIQERYREAINNKFDSLKIDENKKSLLKFRNRVESILTKPNAQHRLRMERDKCFNKLSQLENDITLWENNIGFFADSENAESMIHDVQSKIEAAKKKIEQLKGRIRMLDEYEE